MWFNIGWKCLCCLFCFTPVQASCENVSGSLILEKIRGKNGTVAVGMSGGKAPQLKGEFLHGHQAMKLRVV